MLKTVCNFLSSANFIRFLGIGSAYIICDILYNKILTVNKVTEKECEDETENDLNENHEVLFFNLSGESCRHHVKPLRSGRCSKDYCPFRLLRKITDILSSSKQTLDICVYNITIDELCESIEKAHRNGVKVRIISDNNASRFIGTKIPRLRKKGIEVRLRQSSFRMNHKYAIIDKKLIISGSANWTLNAICGNDENIVITPQKQLVSCYEKNFEKLWLKYA